MCKFLDVAPALANVKIKTKALGSLTNFDKNSGFMNVKCSDVLNTLKIVVVYR